MGQASAPLHGLAGPALARLIEALRAAPDTGAHLRELARGAGVSLSSLQRDLGLLASLGALERTTQGNRVLIRLRREEPFVKLLLAASTALELRGVELKKMPSDRRGEAALAALCAHLPPDAALWRRFGDAGFLAGIAVMLAGHTGFDRAAYLALAESLSPGASTFERYDAWCREHRPRFARLVPAIDRERHTHARAAHQ